MLFEAGVFVKMMRGQLNHAVNRWLSGTRIRPVNRHMGKLGVEVIRRHTGLLAG